MFVKIIILLKTFCVITRALLFNPVFILYNASVEFCKIIAEDTVRCMKGLLNIRVYMMDERGFLGKIRKKIVVDYVKNDYPLFNVKNSTWHEGGEYCVLYGKKEQEDAQTDVLVLHISSLGIVTSIYYGIGNAHKTYNAIQDHIKSKQID